ncbi:MAG: biotin--[acetyl-CoA-carboxylase] ligase [Alcanivoracaceae bacterium]|nr:biotin--[acetyl-CoA-carboxylase] ligase [Alcanivoracaceae bacterium]
MDTELITQLGDGEFHSGEALGKALDISRAAVWKRIERLAALGVDVERVRGKGYRVPGGIALLDGARLKDRLSESFPVEVVLSTGSTNEDVVARLRDQQQAPLALLAEHQSAGRGRRGRAWSSPFATNLYLTLGWRFGVGAPRLEGLSLAVGVVVAQALAAAGLDGAVSLKWPNDIWVAERKIGGVLIELSGDLEEACTAAIGIGINGRLGTASAVEIDQPWTDFYREAGRSMDRTELAIDLLQGLALMLKTFPAQGFDGWRKRWAELDALSGRLVSVSTAAGSIQGVAEGVDETGALRLRVDGELRIFHGGEASLRPAGAAAEPAGGADALH